MDSRYRFLTLGIPWTQSKPSRDVDAATRLAEASWRRDNVRRMDRGLVEHLAEPAMNRCLYGFLCIFGIQ